MYRCGNTIYYYIFIGIAVLYKLILHAIGLVLAWLTRKVEIDVLNDYKSTVATVICSSILMIALCIALPLLSFSNSPFEFNAVWATLAFLIIGVHLGLIFIPKVSFRLLLVLSYPS